MVKDELGRSTASAAKSYFGLCSTVEDALTVSSVGLGAGGVTSMHDATEGGVLGALYELAQSGKRTLRIAKEDLMLSEESRRVCGLFGLDPFVTVSEGTLLITCSPQGSSEVLRRLGKKRIAAAVIGNVGETGRGRLIVTAGGKDRSYVPPKFDPYWSAYTSGLEKGWK
jgi:hydrogenase maturation factor